MRSKRHIARTHPTNSHMPKPEANDQPQPTNDQSPDTNDSLRAPPIRTPPCVTSDLPNLNLRSPQVGGGSLASLVSSRHHGNFLSSFRSRRLAPGSALRFRIHCPSPDG